MLFLQADKRGPQLSTRSLQIESTLINDNSDCFVIAEIGNNHQGNVETCKELFKAAKEAGADAVKLQKRDNSVLFTQAFYDSPYNSENAYGPTYGLHREALEFNEGQYRELQAYAKELGVIFFATAFDIPSADFLAKLDIPCFKIASGDITNLPLLRYVAKMGKPMIISTGAATMEEVRLAYEAIMPINKQLAILQCTATYPSEFSQLDIGVISTYRSEFPDVVIGFSSHDSGIAMAIAGYMLGARIVEKHFTLNRAWRGTDHAFSLEPVGLRKMVRDLRRTKQAVGDGNKKLWESEKAARGKMGKKLVASKSLPVGHILQETDLAAKCPGDGLPPYHLEAFIGKTLVQALEADDAFTYEHIGQALQIDPTKALALSRS